MRNRVYLNLAVFAILGIVMTVWAFSTIIKLDVIERPYRVEAEFASSPGLVHGFDVAYLGVRVGRIGDVRLAPGKIVVGLDIDKEIRLPRSVTAEVRRKSAIGEPYVELTPPKTGAGGPVLAAGDLIPLARTSVPLDYRKLFQGVGRLLNAVPPEDARTITHELAVALEGRAPDIRAIIDDAHDVTDTLADNSKVLDELAVELTRLTHTLAGERHKISSAIRDTGLVTDSVVDARTDLYAFLDQGPGVFAQLHELMLKARPGFSCALTAAGLPHRPAFSAESERYAHHLLGLVPTTLALADDISDRQGNTTYGRNTFIFSVPGGPTPAYEYADPLGPPAVPGVRSCPKAVAAEHSHPDAAVPGGEREREEPQERQVRRAAPTQDETTEPEPTLEPLETTSSSPKKVAAPAPLDTTPLIVAIFLAVAASGGIVGWIAVGRAARRRGTE
ncbi:MlaD family protein [Nonomuraea soli]|uniref:Phospholipid/cholesterol/gamma-HCH transport system substrate-binding protein n=1 Tax=Nonomuraea soli TaxID=1032476 RepID=A0A7W0CEX1_9ACTN|nr:MCE family protein [Nonomuraea soli]MBA2889878.1 phospholipid/cholesterol/gamma-HCH transport system substrate-binding protein [Nonomuraea soli]